MGGDDQGATVATRQSGHATTAVARNAINLVLGQAATTVLAIVLSAALGRYLGAEDFGLYYLITTMSGFAYVFVEWGQPLYVMREVALNLSKSGELLGSALALRTALAFLAATSAGFIAWALGYEARTRWLATLFILANLPVFLSLGYGMVFRARDRMGSDAAVSVCNKALMLCLTLPLLAFGAGIPGVLVAQTLAGAAALGLAAALYRRLRLAPLRANSQAVRALLAGGAPILVMSTATSVQPYLDAIVLSRLAPAIVVGWFGAARSVLGTLIAPAVILGAASFPTLARASADPTALRIEVQRALRPVLWLGALAGTGTYLFAETAIGLIYGARAFGPAATILEVFAPGLFLLFIDILFGCIVYACGRGTGFAIAKITSVVVGTTLDIVLVPLFQERYGNGGIGIVVAFALSEFVMFAGCMLILPRGTLGARTALDVARALGTAAITLTLFRQLPGLTPWVAMPLCVAIFAAVSFASGLTSRRDVIQLWSVIQSRMATSGDHGSGPSPS